MSNSSFNYNDIPLGYYDDIAKEEKGMRSFWHNQKFQRILDTLPLHFNSILDIGCFSGTFLSMVPKSRCNKQFGVDILKTQIDYANNKYGTDFRTFIFSKNTNNYDALNGNTFDVITLIEVIEHLNHSEINEVIDTAHQYLNTKGKLLLTTPNYSSIWPVLEIILNKVSDVKYEEQHITKFTFFNFVKRIKKIVPGFENKFRINIKTTTHFLSPYVAIFSYKLARKLSKSVKPKNWNFPFGSLIMVELEKI